MVYTKKEYSEIKTNLDLNIVSNVDEINDLNPGSVLDIVTSSIAIEISQQYDDLETIYNSTRITTATNEDLDELGLLLGVERNKGSKSNGVVTFIRQQEATSDFIIPQGTQISTLPNSFETTYTFITDSDTTFYSVITNESHTFINGVYEYILNSKLIKSISNMTGTVSGSSNTFSQGTDFSIIKKYDDLVEDTTNFILLDNCDSSLTWTQGDLGLAPTNNVGTFYQGTASVNLTKSSTAGKLLSYTQTLSSNYDITDNDLIMRLFALNQTTLDKISKITIFAGNSGATTNSYYMEYDSNDLTINKFNLLYIDINNDLTKTSGNPDSTVINYIKILIELNNNTDTISTGDIMMDFWHLSKIENVKYDIIQFDKSQNIPDDSTSFLTTYKPLSVDITVTSSIIGEGNNVSSGKIIYKNSNIPNIDTLYNYESLENGSDVETDEDYKDRIQNASALKSLASVDSIKYNVLELDYVSSAKVIDTPELNISNETNTYITGTDKYTLVKEVAKDDNTLIVTSVSNILNGAIDNSVTTITLTDASSFSNSGAIIIDNEVIIYTGKSTNDLTGCSRGSESTTAISHLNGATVKQFFIKNTDYYLTNTNEIDFSLGGNIPGNGIDFYTTYNYNWLGHFYVYVIGESGLITTPQLTEVTNLVDEIKSAGVIGHVYQPTIINITTTLTLTIDNDYSESTAQLEVENQIINTINNLDIGSDVLIANLIKNIMTVEGVLNVAITDLGGSGNNDYVIESDEIAKSSTITFN